jgi:tetratricopeptide (TPR) repeat protein
MHPDWIEWKNVFELQLEELQELQRSVRLLPTQRIYVHALVSYALRDLSELKKNYAASQALNPKDADSGELQEAIQLRIAILEKSEISVSAIDEKSPAWRGELSFLQAKLLEVHGKFAEAAQLYERAATFFTQDQAQKKALKSSFNASILRGKTSPAGKGLHILHAIVERAVAIGDHGVHFAATQNLAWELSQIGAFSVALQILNQTLEQNVSSENTADSVQVRILLCDLLLASGLGAEAQLEKERCIAAGPEEARMILELSERYWAPESKLSLSENEARTLPFPWNERWLQRMRHGATPPRLTEQECRIIEVLMKGPLDRAALISALFGTHADESVELTRFYSILKRLRKKIPGIISFEDELYSLSS